MNKSISNLDGHEFEDLIERLIIKMGFITQERKKSADGGIDILAINEQPLYKGKYIIQCKRYSKPVGVSKVRDLYGVVTSERANKGILITNSSFTNATKDFAKEKPIELIDGKELSNLLDTYLNQSIPHNGIDSSQGMIIPESYKITVEILEPAIRLIAERREKVNKRIVFLKRKDYGINKYIGFCSKKFNKLIDLIDVHENQLNYLNEIWRKSIRNKESYANLKEVKAHCTEIVVGLNLIETEWEEVLSTHPPDNLWKTYSLMCELYDFILTKAEAFILDFTNTMESLKDTTSEKDIYLKFNFILDVPENWVARFKKANYEAMAHLNPVKANKMPGCALPIIGFLILIIFTSTSKY